jgi:phosphoglycerate kinase
MEGTEKPCIFVIGGAKADDSLKISRHVLANKIADRILTGGITANLFLSAKGFNLGSPSEELLKRKSLRSLIPGIRELLKTFPERVEVPMDLAVEYRSKRLEIAVEELPTDHPVYDIGIETAKKYSEIISCAKSVVISGPMGVFEKNRFMLGTKMTFRSAAMSEAFSLVGGGHTVAAIKKLGLTDKISYISTAGGALIEFLMGERLPGIAALEEAAARA